VTISMFLLAMWLGMAGNVYNNNEDPQLNLNLHVYGKAKVYYGGKKSSESTVLKLREFYNEAVLREGGSPVLVENVAQGRCTILMSSHDAQLLDCRDNSCGHR
jgi:hypothetical protein